MGSVPALDLRWRSERHDDPLLDLIYAHLDDFEPLAIHDHETALAASASFDSRVFFKTTSQRDAAASALLEAFAAAGLAVEPVDVEDENWAARSQANLQAIRVGGIVVAPPWATSTDITDDQTADNTDNAGILKIVIEPSTGFGTGHHETTRLCLALLQQVGVDGARAIDVGTGSGVLAIAAAKLGASAVVAFDEDPLALDNARENVERNGVTATIDVRELDLGSPAFDLEPAALVMANLTIGGLVKYAERLKDLVDDDGALLVSGFAPTDVDELVEAFEPAGAQVRTEGAWAAALFRFTDLFEED